MAKPAALSANRESRLTDQIADYLDPRTRLPFLLRFPPALEARYDHDRRRQPDARPRILAVATLIIASFTAGDYALSPATLERSLFFRVYLLVPFSAVALWLLHRPRLRAHRDPIYLAISLFAAACCIAAFPGYDPITSLYTQVTFVLVLWIVVAATRLKMHLAVFCMVCLWLGEVLLLLQAPWLSRAQRIISLAQFTAAAVLSGIARHRADYTQRVSYLLRLREQLRGAKLSDLNKTLTQLSTHDPLTGVANRRHFDRQLQTLWDRALGAGAPLSLAMVDVDHFKRLNDTYGHAAGDRVLVRLAETLCANVRTGFDLVARFGGEEFVILFPDLPEPETLHAAERLRLAVAAAGFPGNDAGQPIRCSISCGIATLRPEASPPSTSPTELLHIADAALYRAKREGRNRVCA